MPSLVTAMGNRRAHLWGVWRVSREGREVAFVSADCMGAPARIMREYMPKRGTLGHDMMFRSCTIQVRV